jgi:tRNA modification GTPase
MRPKGEQKLRSCQLLSLCRQAFIAYFPGPASYSGEDMVELGLHGGPAVIQAALAALAALPDHRLSEPGEFSRRAFHNGKLDLVEIEGLADLIAAETEAQRLQALRQAEGEASRLYEEWRGALVGLMALNEAMIDFSEDDILPEISERVNAGLIALGDEIERHLERSRSGERLRDGLMVAILGAPNAGKSSLLNRLSGREAAIVAATAGTTRDVIEVRFDLQGMPATLADTAGLRQSLDEVESEGVRRALERAKSADLRVLVFDGARFPEIDPETARLIDQGAILVLNKADLGRAPAGASLDGRKLIPVSALLGDGIAELMEALSASAAALMPAGEGPVVTRARHRAALTEALEALRRGAGESIAELRGEELRVAATALSRLVGRIDVEDVLDGIFREFCIGK